MVYATNLLHALPERGGDDPRHPGARPARRRRRDPERDRRLGRRRAARVDLPRALRRPERRVVPRAVRRAAPAGRRRAARPEAELVDRAGSWRCKLGLGAYYPWKTIEEYLEHRLTKAGLSFDELKQRGDHPRREAAGLLRGGRRARVPDAVGQDRVLLDAAARRRVRSGADVHAPGAAARGAFRLLFGRAPVHSFSRTQSNPILADMMAENEVWVNADVARAARARERRATCACGTRTACSATASA